MVKTEYFILFLLLIVLPFSFIVNDERAETMVQEIKQKGYNVIDYDVCYIESGPFFRLKGCVIVKMRLSYGSVIWGRSGIFKNDYALDDGTLIE